ncbi:hypothetical protein FPV67DRAFT_300612 [Lyophyllum atratum]|nr:hypothetical protein FPV67DRAFT_300612 [Lyophyllum atratum]
MTYSTVAPQSFKRTLQLSTKWVNGSLNTGCSLHATMTNYRHARPGPRRQDSLPIFSTGAVSSPSKPPAPKQIDRTLSGLNNAISAIDIVKEIVPLQLVKGVLSTISGILGIVKNTIQNQDDFLELAEQCHTISLVIWRATSGVQESEISPAIRRTLSELNEFLSGIREAVDEQVRKRMASKVFHVAINKDVIAGWRRDLDRFLILFNTELHVTANLKLEELLASFEEFRTTVKLETDALVPDALPLRPPIFVGREALVREATESLSKRHHVALIGPGGMGKTSIARAVLNEDSISTKFGEHRYFVRYDDVDASQITHATFLDRIARVLGIKSSKANTRSLILRALSSSDHILVVLDNAETFLDAASDASHIATSIDEFGACPNVVIMLTTRTSGLPPNLKWERLRVPALDESAACTAFMAIYLHPVEPLILTKLLSALDFHPLSINLLAQVAVQNDWSSAELIAAWDRQHALLLENGDGKVHSIAMTIEMSLNSPSLKKLGHTIRHTLQVIAFLPQGINRTRLAEIFPSIPTIESCTDVLCKHSLAYRKGDFITMLAPIRLYVSSQYNHDSFTAIPLLNHVQTFYNAHLERDPVEKAVIQVEDVNIEHVIAQSIANCDVKTMKRACILATYFLDALTEYKPRATALHLLIKELKAGEPSARSLLCFNVADRRRKHNMRAKAICLFAVATLQIEVGQYVEARDVLKEVRDIAVACGRTGRDLCRLADMGIGEAYATLGNYAMAEASYESSLRPSSVYKSTVDRYLDAYSYQSLASVRMLMGKPDCAEMALRGLKFLQRMGDGQGVLQARCAAGYAELVLGNDELAARQFKTALEAISEEVGSEYHSRVVMGMAEVAYRQGKTAEAESFRNQLSDSLLPKSHASAPHALSILPLLSAYKAMDGDVSQARSEIYLLVDEATQSIDARAVNCFYVAGCIELQDDADTKAADMFRQTIDYCKAFSEFYFRARAERALGEIALLYKDFASAEVRFAETKALCDFMGIPTDCLYQDHICYALSGRYDGWRLFQDGRLPTS